MGGGLRTRGMKTQRRLSRVLSVLAVASLATAALAQPPPGGPGGPGGPGPGGPGGPGSGPGGPGPRPPLPPRFLPPPEYFAPHRIHRSYRSSSSASDSTTAQVQRKLKALGYFAGSVDGAIGPITRASIRSYQEEKGLEITGSIDRALLGSLGL